MAQVSQPTRSVPSGSTQEPDTESREMRPDFLPFPQMTEEQLQNFCVSKINRQNPDKLISLDFSDNGEKIFACTRNDVIVTYNGGNGFKREEIPIKKYGGGIVKYGPISNTLLHSSKIPHTSIRYLDLNEYRYIRYLSGHQEGVLSLSLSRINHLLISGSKDRSVRLWDFRSDYAINVKHFQGETISSFHPDGQVIATGIQSHEVEFHDVRFNDQPFTNFQIQDDSIWGDLKFSNNGKFLLISTNRSRIYLLDPLKHTINHTFEGYDNSKAFLLEASFTPDSQFVMIGSEDGKVHIWNAESGRKVAVLSNKEVSSINCLQFNPRLMSLVSASDFMAFWEPKSLP